MKKIYLITVIMLTGLFSCVQQKSSSTDNKATKTDSLNVRSELTIDKEITINNKTINWTDFDKVYAYLDLKNEFTQILGVKWYGIDSVDYQIICSSMLCEMEIHGTAKANHPDGDSEIDEDENGGYPVDEFLFETTDYVVSVRIDAEKKSKARLIYSPKGDINEDCEPKNELIMKIINAR